MSDLYIQLPADSTGKRLHTRVATSQGVQAHQGYQVIGDAPTYYAWSGTQTMINNKYLIALTNTDSTQVIKVRKLFLVNGQLAAATGVMVPLNVCRIGTTSGGAAITATATDPSDGALSGVTIVSSPTTVQLWGYLWPWFTTNDEIGATGGFPQATLQSLGNLMMEGQDVRPLTLRQNQGVAVRWSTTSVVGTFGVLAVFTVEKV